MLIFCDKNKSLVEKVKAIMPTDFWGEQIKVVEGDVFEVAKTNNCLIATASNPKFNMSGGLDALIKKEFPKECKNPTAWTKSEHLYFVVSVDERINATKAIVKTALMNIFGNRHLGIVFTGLGTGIGNLTEDEFCEVLKEVLEITTLKFQAIDVVGYKAFDDGWLCRNKKYEQGQEYEEEGVEICNRGMHFCRKATDILEFYNNPFFIAEVLGNGEAEEHNNKVCVSKMTVTKDVTWNRSRLMNSGHCNSGDINSGNWNSGNSNSGNCNSGNWNSGDSNSGDSNSGHRNSGNWNSGNSNSGNCNSGNWNSGNWNSGNSNSGHRNSGNWNSGDSNSGDSNSGVFNSDEPFMRSFNKMTKIKMSGFINSNDYIYFELPINTYRWFNEMTEEEKTAHPECKTTGGYLKTLGYKEAWSEWRSKNKSETITKKIKNLPNFNAKIFKEITGLDIK